MMSSAIDEVFQPLRNEVIEIHMAWRLYRQAFATCEERVMLLNRYAAVWFGYAQAAMYDDIVISLFRLLDPPNQGRGRDNLTLARLADVVEEDGQADLANVIRKARNRVEALLQPFADWRHKRVAHNDLARMPAKWQGNQTTPGPSHQTIEEALDGVRECMNSVDQHYQNSTTQYAEVILPLEQDGEALIEHLERYDRHLEAIRAEVPTPGLRARWPYIPPDVQQCLRDFHSQRQAGAEKEAEKDRGRK